MELEEREFNNEEQKAMNMRNKTINIILANAPVNNGNRGCVALSITMMSLIDDVMKNAGEKYHLFLPDSMFSDQKEHVYKIENKEIVFEDCKYPQGLSAKENIKMTIKAFLKRGSKSKRIFKNADFILDIGQGDSFADIYGERRFRLIDRIHVLARKYKKPYCILPQTIGPFKDNSIRARANTSIRKAAWCMARDKQSYDYVINNIADQKNIQEYIDVAFFLPYKKITQDEKFTHIGLNVSALIWNGGYTRTNQFGLKCDYQKTIRAIIDYFLSLPNTKVHLIPHVVLSERHIENDYEVSYDLWREYNNPSVILAPFALSPIDIKSYIAGMDFFMGARMHATIGAFSSGVPVVPMAYSRKFNGLFVDTLQYDTMADMKTMSTQEVLAVVKGAFGKRKHLSEIINERMNGVIAERKVKLIEALKSFFNLK